MHDSEMEGELEKATAELTGTLDDKISPLHRRRVNEPLPSRAQIVEMTALLRSALFPGYFGGEECSPDSIKFHVGSAIADAASILEEQTRRAYCFFCNQENECPACREKARGVAMKFVSALPRVQQLLESDVQAAYEGDPAATCPAETVFCYPGIYAITNQRIAHELYKLKVPLIPRIITENAHSLTGIDIHPGAAIGPHFFIDHGTGVVIGETAVIGEGVRLYQGVTLGAKSFPLDENGNPVKGIKRHPTVEDGVIIYAGATILGTSVIGAGSVIGGNVWLTHSVPPGSKITHSDDNI